MSYTTTPRLGLYKPTVDADDNLWGGHLNQNADVLDTLVGSVANVLTYGAALDGTTDDTAAVQAALNSGRTHVVVPAGRTAYCPGGIIVPSGVTLDGISLQMENGNHPIAGSTILVSPTTPVAVTLGNGTAGANPAAIQNIRVESTSAAPTVNTIGILCRQAIPTTLLTNVMVFGFGVGIKTQNGITVYMHNIFSGRISDAHYVNDGTPEIHVTKWRMGVYGGDAYPAVISNCYIRAMGGMGGAAAANTMRFSQCHFNDSNLTGYLMECVQFGVASSAAGLYVFEDSFCQGVGIAYFRTDATWLNFDTVQIIGCSFDSGAGTPNPCPLFALNPATSIHGLFISASAFFLSVNLAPTAPADLRNIHITGNSFSNGPVSFTASSGGTMSFVGNMVLNSSLTFNGNWADLTVVGNNFNGASSCVNNATGNVKILGTNPYAVFLSGIPSPVRSLIGSSLALNSLPKQGEFEQMVLSGTDGAAAYCATRTSAAGSLNGAQFIGQASRGAAYGTHGAVGGTDGILTINAFADDGTNWRTAAGALRFAVEGAVSAGIVPTQFAVYTTNTAGVGVQGLVVNSNQAVTIANLLRIAGVSGPTINAGAGAATGTQPAGSLWMRSDGAVGSRLYVSQGGGSWLPVAGV